ncbi:MAG: hypothetical protein IJK28_01305 [Clostridia bacterium]|nr:hypothetical protein [Clostridia bacterium]
MKRLRRFLAVLLSACLLAGAALAETFYVKQDLESPLSLRDEFTNEILTVIPAGTALEPDGEKSSDLFAYVTYGGLSGYVLWNGLTRTPPETPEPPSAETPAAQTPDPGTPPPPAETPPPPATGTDLVPSVSRVVTAVNATIRRTNEKNKAVGDSYDTLTVSPEDSVLVTATIPRGKSIDYWVINGVSYRFSGTVKSIRLTGFDRSWTLEAVLKKTDPQTLHTAEDRPPLGEGERKVIRVEGGDLCHMKNRSTGGGGWIESFDFTYDYENRATGAEEHGGQVTCKVRAAVPRGRKILGWRFGGTEFYPSPATKSFVVEALDTAMTYAPILNPVPDPTPPPTPTPSPSPTPVPLVKIDCKGCVFSGGGYTDATSGEVLPGTEITVRSWYFVQTWTVNGAIVLGDEDVWYEEQSLTRTVTQDTTFICVHRLKESK